MLRVAIVDDEQEVRGSLEEYFGRLGQELKLNLKVWTFFSGSQFLAERMPFDLVCLDIEMPEMNGLELAAKIRKTDEQVVIVFITYLAQMAIHGYEVRALDFLVKPVNYSSFSMKVLNVLKRLEKRKCRNLAVLTVDGLQKISTEELYYVEVQGHYLYYHTRKGTFRQKASLKEVEEELKGLSFTKCNQCYLVNLRYASAVSKDEVQVAQDWLKISRPKKKNFLAALADYIGGVGP